MAKVLVVGRREDVLPFRAAGAEVREASDVVSARKAIAEAAAEGGPALLLLTEDLAEECAAEVAAYRSARDRAVLVIPTARGATGRRREHVRRVVSHAVGVDLLGRPADHASQAAEPAGAAEGEDRRQDTKGQG